MVLFRQPASTNNLDAMFEINDSFHTIKFRTENYLNHFLNGMLRKLCVSSSNWKTTFMLASNSRTPKEKDYILAAFPILRG